MHTPLETTLLMSETGYNKTQKSWQHTVVQGIGGGMFIALGAMFSLTTSAGINEFLPYGLAKLISGTVFCLGLLLCVIAGAQLYTGNALLVIAKAEQRISWRSWIQNLLRVWWGNFLGALIIIALLFLSFWHGGAEGEIGNNLLQISQHKLNLSPLQAITAGILCNILVCLGIWLASVGKSLSDKVIAILFPITAFVAGGFEHIVANMFYLPYAYLLNSAGTIPELTIRNILIHNFLPVTFGNLLGGAFFVGLFYRFLYGTHSPIASKS